MRRIHVRTRAGAANLCRTHFFECWERGGLTALTLVDSACGKTEGVLPSTAGLRRRLKVIKDYGMLEQVIIVVFFALKLFGLSTKIAVEYV